MYGGMGNEGTSRGPIVPRNAREPVLRMPTSISVLLYNEFIALSIDARVIPEVDPAVSRIAPRRFRKISHAINPNFPAPPHGISGGILNLTLADATLLGVNGHC